MFILYFVFILACFSVIKGAYKAIHEKNMKNLVGPILLFPFFFSFFVSVLSGGSALNDAKADYALYQVGHYYLVSHGAWTEVTYQRYLFVFISEIIGFLSFALTFLLGFIQNRSNKPKPIRL